MKCDSLLKKPADPLFLQLTDVFKKDILIKTFMMQNQAEKMDALVYDAQGRMTTIDYKHNKYGELDELGYRVYGLANTSDCIVKTDFLTDPDMAKKFNFAKDYTTTDKNVSFYDPIDKTYKIKSCFYIVLRFLEIFKYCNNIGVFQDENCPVIETTDDL